MLDEMRRIVIPWQDAVPLILIQQPTAVTTIG
jgi:hypothetical protein